MTDRAESLDPTALDDDTPPWVREDEAQRPTQPPVGTSPLARQLEEDGTLAAIEAENTRSRNIAEAKAFLESRKKRLKEEMDATYGPQTPAVPVEEDTSSELRREIGRSMAGGIPQMGGAFLRQVAGSLADLKQIPDDPNDPNYALARAIHGLGERVSAYGERNVRAIPATRVGDVHKIRGDSLKNFLSDTSDYFTAKMGQAIGYGVPMLAGGVAFGLPGLAVTSLPLGVGEVRHALEEEGIDDAKLLQSYGWIAGAAIGALDAIVPYDILTTEVKKGLTKYMLVRMAKTAGHLAAEEGATEALQEAVQVAAVAEARGLHVGEDRQAEAIYNMGRELFEKRWEIFEAGVGGAVGGPTLGATKIAASARPPKEGEPDADKPVKEARVRGSTRTDVTPQAAPAEEAPKEPTYDVKQFYPEEIGSGERAAQAGGAEQSPDRAEQAGAGEVRVQGMVRKPPQAEAEPPSLADEIAANQPQRAAGEVIPEGQRDLAQAKLSRQMSEVLAESAARSEKLAEGGDLYWQMRAHEQRETAKLYAQRADDIEAGRQRHMPGPDEIKALEERVKEYNDRALGNVPALEPWQETLAQRIAELAAPLTSERVAVLEKDVDENLPGYDADIRDAYQAEGLDPESLSDEDIRSIAFYMAQGLNQYEALERYAAEGYESERAARAQAQAGQGAAEQGSGQGAQGAGGGTQAGAAPAGGAAAQPAGARPGGAAAQRVGGTGERSQGAGAAQQPGSAQSGVQQAQAGAASPAELEYQSRLRQSFRSMLGAPTKDSAKVRIGKWATRNKISPDDLKPLVDEAVGAGLLRIDRNGVIKRTPLARKAPRAARPRPAQEWMGVPPDMRAETALRNYENATGRSVPDDVRRWNENLEMAFGRPQFEEEIRALKGAADVGDLSLADLQQLAAIFTRMNDKKVDVTRKGGKKRERPPSKFTKNDAIFAILKRHKDQVEFLKKQSARGRAVTEMMAIASAGQTGQEQRRDFDQLGFYSALKRAAEDLENAPIFAQAQKMLANKRKPDAIFKATGVVILPNGEMAVTPEKALELIRGTPGVKEAEIKATGLDKFIADRIGSGTGTAPGDRGPITKLASPEKVWYHGTNEESIPVFHVGRSGLGSGLGTGAIWFSDAHGSALDFGENVIPANLALNNPLILESPPWSRKLIPQYVAQAKAGGHDGLIVTNVRDGAYASNLAAVFDNKSILQQSGDREGRLPGRRERNLNQVTRSEIVSYLRDNRVEVREAQYADAYSQQTRNALARQWHGIDYHNLRDIEAKEIDEHLNIQAGVAGPAKWSQYSLDPSNPTYRETVIHLPVKRRMSLEEFAANYRKEFPHSNLTAEEMRAAYQHGVEVPGDSYRGDDVFRGGHYTEPNVIAHARTSLQKMKVYYADASEAQKAQWDAFRKEHPSGEVPVFLIDELQSDWGQKLREGGVRDEGKIAELTKQIEDTRAFLDSLQKPENEVGELEQVPFGFGRPLKPEAEQMAIDWLTKRDGGEDALENYGYTDRWDYILAVLTAERLLEAELRTAQASTPGHPLVNTTDQWTTTAFRRLIRQAVEAGAEYIAITPGKVQADRFNLSQHITGVRWSPTNNSVEIRQIKNGVVQEWDEIAPIKREDLPAYIGKELTERLLATEPKVPPATAAGEYEYAVHQLDNLGSVEVGGHGMRSTYDGIYPRNLLKILRGLDPGIKQEETALQSSMDGRTFKEGESTTLARAGARSSSRERAPPILFHVFPLTPSVKASVLGGGQALFSIAGRGPQRLTPAEINKLDFARYAIGTMIMNTDRRPSKEERAKGLKYGLEDSPAEPLTEAEKAEGWESGADIFMEVYGVPLQFRELHGPAWERAEDGSLTKRVESPAYKLYDRDTGFVVKDDALAGMSLAIRIYAEQVAWQRLHGRPDDRDLMGPWHPDFDLGAWRDQHPLSYRHPINDPFSEENGGGGFALFSIASQRSQASLEEQERFGSGEAPDTSGTASVPAQAGITRLSLEEREAKARSVMESPAWKTAAEKPADITRDTSKVAGYGSPEWQAARRYVAADGEEIAGFEAAVDHLAAQATDAVPGGVATERRAFILMGYPGGGKTSIGMAVRDTFRAARVVGDDAKPLIPEYDGGRNNGGIKTESDHLIAAVAARLVDDGANIIIETTGRQDVVEPRLAALKARGYSTSLVFIDTPKAIAMERAVARFEREGRPVAIAHYDAVIPADTYAKVKNDGSADETARITQGEVETDWRLAESSPALEPLGNALQQTSRGQPGGRPGPGDAGLRQGLGYAAPTPATVEPREPAKDWLDGSVAIMRGDEEIGEAHFFVQSNETENDTVFFHWIEVQPGQRLTLADIRSMREAFRQHYPSVVRFEGERNSGARASAEDSFQSVVMAAVADAEPRHRPFTSQFQAALPTFATQLREQLERMVPPDVAVRVADRLFLHGIAADELVHITPTPRFDFAKMATVLETKFLLEVALRTPSVNRTPLGSGFHGVVHVLREKGLWSDEEWALLVERAKKTGVDRQMLIGTADGKTASTIPLYRQLYEADQRGTGNFIWEDDLQDRVNELMDQELVAKLAEHFLAGRAKYGSQIDTLLQRIQQFFEALWNALRRMGFQTVDDVFERALSGEVADRQGGRREPGFSPTLSPQQVMLSSHEGQEAMDSYGLMAIGRQYEELGYARSAALRQARAEYDKWEAELSAIQVEHNAAIEEGSAIMEQSTQRTHKGSVSVDEAGTTIAVDEQGDRLAEISPQGDGNLLVEFADGTTRVVDGDTDFRDVVFGTGKYAPTPEQQVAYDAANARVVETLARMREAARRMDEAGQRWWDIENDPSPFPKEPSFGLMAIAGPKAAQTLAAGGRPAAAEALALAQRMEAEGTSRDGIWSATADLFREKDPALIGVFKGVDGAWRFEIDDSASRKRYWDAGRLSSVVRNPDLYAAYPGLARTQVKKILGLDALLYGGKYDPTNRTIHYRPIGDVRSDLGHEAQHFIQDIEDFARGANPNATLDTLDPAQRAQLIEALAENIFERNKGYKERGIPNLRSVSFDELRARARQAAEAAVNDNTIAYTHQAGEVEARNVQARLTMSPEARRALPPWKTQDVADELQIISRIQDEPMFAIGGPKAKTAPLSSRNLAESMERKGAKAEAIWRDTGWYRGPDGLWRFEIDDSKAKLLIDTRAKEEGETREFDAPLPEVLKHPALFDAYPILRDIGVFVGMGEYYQGMGSGVEDGHISVYGQTADEVLDILLHEIQHLVQEIEGFSPGGHPKSIAATNEIRQFEIEREIERLEASGTGHNILPYLKEAREALDRSKALMLMGWFGPEPGVREAYNRLYGEVEARNVMARRKMSAKERRASLPETTQDRPTAGTIFTEEPVAAEIDPATLAVVKAAWEETAAKHPGALGDFGRFTDSLARDGVGYLQRRALKHIQDATDYIATESSKFLTEDVERLKAFDRDAAYKRVRAELEKAWRSTIRLPLSSAARQLRALRKQGNEEFIFGSRLADPAIRALVDRFPKLAAAFANYQAYWADVQLDNRLNYLDGRRAELRAARAHADLLEALADRAIEDLPVNIRRIDGLDEAIGKSTRTGFKAQALPRGNTKAEREADFDRRYKTGKALKAAFERQWRALEAIANAKAVEVMIEVDPDRYKSRPDLARFGDNLLHDAMAGHTVDEVGEKGSPFYRTPEYAEAYRRFLAAVPKSQITALQAAALDMRHARGALASFFAPQSAIAGPKAKTAPLSSRNLAESMERKGKKPEQIFEDTGWFRGPDQMWRFEIDDSAAKVVNLDTHLKAPTNTLFRSLIGAQPKGQPKWAKGKVRLATNVKLPDILSHSKLYAAYPFLKEMRANVIVGEGVPKAKEGGALIFREAGGKLVYSPIVVRARTQSEVLPTLMHEVQHYIQKKEGFGGGSRPSTREGIGPNKKGEYPALDFDQRTDKPIAYPGLVFSPDTIANRNTQNPAHVIPMTKAEEIALDLARMHEYRDRYDKLPRRLKQIWTTRDALDQSIARHQAVLVNLLRVTKQDYLASLGEQEAELVAQRLSLTPEQRRAAAPLLTEGVQSRLTTSDLRPVADEVFRRAQFADRMRKERGKTIDLAPGIKASWYQFATSAGEMETFYVYADARRGQHGRQLHVSVDRDTGVAFIQFAELGREDIGEQGDADDGRPVKPISDARLNEILDVVEKYLRSFNLFPTGDPRLYRDGSEPQLTDAEFAFWKARDPLFMMDDPRSYKEDLKRLAEQRHGKGSQVVLATDYDYPRDTYRGGYEANTPIIISPKGDIIGLADWATVEEIPTPAPIPADLQAAGLDPEIWKIRTPELHEAGVADSYRSFDEDEARYALGAIDMGIVHDEGLQNALIDLEKWALQHLSYNNAASLQHERILRAARWMREADPRAVTRLLREVFRDDPQVLSLLSERGERGGTTLASIAGPPPTPRSFALPLPGYEGSVIEKEKEGGDRIRTYKVRPAVEERFGSGYAPDSLGPARPDQRTGEQGDRGTSQPAPGASPEPNLSSFIVSEQPNGSWELSFFNVREAVGSRQLAVVAAIEADLGNRLSPSGWLTPDSYEHWKKAAPDKVKFHQDAGPLFGGMWVSPKAVEFGTAVLQEASAQNRDSLSLEGRGSDIQKKLARLQELSSSLPQSQSLASIASWIGGPFERVADWVKAKYYALGYPGEEAILGVPRWMREGDADALYVDGRGVGYVWPDGNMFGASPIQHDMGRFEGPRRFPTREAAQAFVMRQWEIWNEEHPRPLEEEPGVRSASYPPGVPRDLTGAANENAPRFSVIEGGKEGGGPTELASISGPGPEPVADADRWENRKTADERLIAKAKAEGQWPDWGDEHRERALYSLKEQEARKAWDAVVTPIMYPNGYKAMERWQAEAKAMEAHADSGLAFQAARLAWLEHSKGGPLTPGELMWEGLDRAPGLPPPSGTDLLETYGREKFMVAGHPELAAKHAEELRSLARTSPLLLASIAGSGSGSGRGGRVNPRLSEDRSVTYDPRAEGIGRAPKPLTQIVADLKQALDMPTTQGLVGLTVRNNETGYSRRLNPQSNVAGQYQTPPGAARIRQSTDIDAIAHEGGHHLEAVIGAPLEALILDPAHAAELDGYAGGVASAGAAIDAGRLSEGFSEFFREFVLSPDRAEVRAPRFYAAFSDLLDAERPDILNDLDQLQIATLSQDYQDYIKATAIERGMADVATWQEPSTWEQIKAFYASSNKRETISQWLSQLSFALTDKTNPILRTQQALLRLADANGVRGPDGRPISLQPGENAHRISRLLARADKIGHQFLVNGVPDYHGMEGIGPSLHSAVAEALGGTSRFAWTDAAIKRFGLYLEARRAVVEWARYLDGELERPPTRKSAEEYDQIIEELDAANPSYARAAQMVYDFQRRLLDLEHQAGKWTDAQYEALVARSNFYVPFQRDLSDISPVPGAPPGKRLADRFTDAKKFKGSDRNIVNPLEAIAKRAYQTAAAIQFNDMVKALTALSERAGVGGAGFIERVQREEVAANNERTFERIKQMAIGLGMDEADAHIAVQQMEMNFDDAQVHLLWDPDNLGPVRPPIVPLWENGERKLVRLNDPVMGRRLFESMNALGREQSNLVVKLVSYPATLLRAGVTMHPAFMLSNLMGDMMAAWTLTGSITRPASYPVVTQARGLYHLMSSNPRMRSAMSAIGIPPSDISELYSRVGGISGGQNVAALRALHRDFDLRELRSRGYSIMNLPAWGGVAATVAGATAGGMVGGVVGATLGASAGAIAGRLIFGEGAEKAFAAFSEMSETMTRLGVASYALKRAKALDPTLSDIDAIREAAFTASDVLDFDRNGAKAGTLMKVIPFFNSNVQGVSKAYRQALVLDGERGKINMEKIRLFLRWQLTGTGGAAMRGALSAQEQHAIRDGARAWVNMAILAMAGAALFLLHKDDPEYEDVGEDIKNTHFVFKLGGTWYRVKKPFELATPANITQAFMEWWMKYDPRLWTKVRDGFVQTHSPPYLPQTIRLWSDMKSGIDTSRNAGLLDTSKNRPIVPDSLRRLPPYMQFTAYSSEFAIQWSRALNSMGISISPLKIDYALNNGIAYWGREIGVSSNYFLGRNREAPKITDRPVVGTIVNRVTLDPSRRSASVDEFWGVMGQGKGKFDQAKAGYDQTLKSGNPDLVKTYLAGLPSEERVYAVLDKHFKPRDKEAHPLNRAMLINVIDNGLRRDMILDNLVDSSVRSSPTRIALSPAKKTEIHDILGRLSALETWNALHDIGIPGWSQRETRNPALVLDELKAASPEVYEEMMRRRRRVKVGDYSDDLIRWGEVKEKVETMIRDEDMLGLAWQKTVRKRRSPVPAMEAPPSPALRMPFPSGGQLQLQ